MVVTCRRLLRGCSAKVLLLLLLFVWTICTVLLTTEDTQNSRVKMHTKIPDIPTFQQKPNRVCGVDKSEFPLLEPHHTKELQQDRTGISAAIVIWCNPKATFTFRHYLSLLSLVKVLKPDGIKFVYAFPPMRDDSGYHQWLEKFGEEYPFLQMQQDSGCCRNAVPNRNWIIERLCAKRGGLFVNIEVILEPILLNVLGKTPHAVEIRDEEGNIALLSMTRTFALKMYKRVHTGISFFYNQSALAEIKVIPPCLRVLKLPEIDVFNKSRMENLHCLKTVEWGDGLYPKLITECTGRLCRYLQTLLYGYSHSNCDNQMKSLDISPSASNVVHYIHFGRLEMKFMFYLSILSFIYIQQVDKVYIHCNTEPSGQYWTKLLINHSDVIRIVHRTNPSLVFNQSITVVQHMADIAKADIAFKYGGILSDPDVIVVQKLRQSWFQNEAVVGLDIGTIFPFPDILNMGIFICKPGNQFTANWIQSMKQFNDSNWLWNSGKLTYKITEQDPTLALVEPRLQVICYNFKCYPTWLPQNVYQNLSTSHETLDNSLQNWAIQAYSFHFTFPEPFFSETYLAKQTGITGDVGRHVMRAAGLSLPKKRA